MRKYNYRGSEDVCICMWVLAGHINVDAHRLFG